MSNSMLNQIERKPPPQKTPYSMGNPYLDKLMKQPGTALTPAIPIFDSNTNQEGNRGIAISQIIPQSNQTIQNPNQMINPQSNYGQSENPIYRNQNLNQLPEYKNPSNHQTFLQGQNSMLPNIPGNPPGVIYEDISKKIQSNIQGLVQQLNSLQENLLSTRNINSKNNEPSIIKNSPGSSNILKGGLINEITPNLSKKPETIPPYPPNLNTTFPSFTEIIGHPKFPPEQSDLQNNNIYDRVNPGFTQDNTFNIHNSNILSSLKNDNLGVNPPNLPDPNQVRIVEAIYQPLEKIIQSCLAGIEAINKEISHIASQSQNTYPSPIKPISQPLTILKEGDQTSNYYPSNSYNNPFSIHPLWQQKIKENITLDPTNEEKVINHLQELVIDPIQMSELIDSIFTTLNNSSNLLSSIEFKEFYDLTSSGMNATPLDMVYIMNEYLSIPKANPIGISKTELNLYVTKMYQAIIIFAQNYMNKPK